MLFHSYTFLVFFVVVLTLHQVLRPGARRYLLLVASYVFYGSWNPYYASLIFFSTLIDYHAGRRIFQAETPGKRRLFLTLSVAVNLGLLGIFKYYNFFAGSLAENLSWQLPIHELLLPVGISFYTFQSMSYTIDIYRRQLEPSRDFVDFALYVSFFPQLVAGPIVRAVDFLPQLTAERPFVFQQARDGLKLFIIGLFKKLVIADNLALIVDRVHADPNAYSAGDLWTSAYAFAFQIYYDFSGYSEMAIGLALVLGFRFPENFRRPYCAVNVSEFWRRWHISLSSWLRDYLYIAMGGSRASRIVTLRNLMLTMVLGGLWHGANWTFIVWGFLHGSFLVVHRLFQSLCERVPVLQELGQTVFLRFFYILLTFHCWTLSMVYFRAADLDQANEMLARMFTPGESFALTGGGYLLLCAVLYVGQAAEERWHLLSRFDDLPFVARVLVLIAVFWLMVLMTPKDASPFLYFQF